MIQSEAPASTGVIDNVELNLYSTDELEAAIPDWDSLDQKERLSRMEELEPDDTITTHNITTQPYREHLAELINPELAVTAVETTYMAFGDDSTAPQLSDDHLINEVHRTEIDDHIDRDAEYATVVLLAGDDAVGLDLVEAALVTEADAGNADDMAVNRVLLDDPEGRLQPKTSDHAVTIKIELSYLDPSEIN